MDLLVRDVICLGENYFTTEPNLHVTPTSDLILYFAARGLILDKCSGSAVNCGHSYILTAFRKKTFVQFAIFFDCDLKALTSSICGDFCKLSSAKQGLGLQKLDSAVQVQSEGENEAK